MKKVLAVAVLALTLVPAAASRTNQECLLTFLTESIPDSTVGDPVNFDLEVCCGTPPYKFKIVEGELPAGLSMDQTGLITGTPTEAADTTVFFRLRDHGAGNCSLVQAYAVRVNPAP